MSLTKATAVCSIGMQYAVRHGISQYVAHEGNCSVQSTNAIRSNLPYITVYHAVNTTAMCSSLTSGLLYIAVFP